MATSIFIDDNNNFVNSVNQIFKYKQDLSKSIRERALEFFKPIVGNDEIKEQLYRALLKDNINTIAVILIGAAATSKTLFMKCIEEGCNNVIFYDAASGSTGAGLIQLLRSNLGTKILIIDEIAEMATNDLKTIRGLCNDGRVSKTLQSKLINFKLKGLKVFATTNNAKKFNADLPLKSRFQSYIINKYTDEEFVKVLNFCLVNQGIIQDIELANNLSHAMIYYQIKNIRTALSICSLISKEDKKEDIERIIENYIAFNAADCNVNFNEEE
jgi:ATPase family protein associated with various cellular activities (AAA)